MFRIDSPGATLTNRFTEGDPGLAVPATVVSSDFMNSVQEEIIKPILEIGIALDKGNEGQLWDALLALALNGGRKAPLLATIANNTVSGAVLDLNNASAQFTVDRTKIKNKIMFFDIERKTATQIVKEYGLLFLAYNSKTDLFESPKVMSLNGDARTVFNLVQVGVTDIFDLQYTSQDLTGGTYVGTLDITSIIEIKQ